MSTLLPTSQTAFSSVTSRAITRITIDTIHTQSTVSTCVIHTVINVQKIIIFYQLGKTNLHCFKTGFSKRSPRGINKIEATLPPTSQTAFSSVTSRAITRITIDTIHTQSTVSTCVIHTVINVQKIIIFYQLGKTNLHCFKTGFSKRSPRGINKIEAIIIDVQKISIFHRLGDTQITLL